MEFVFLHLIHPSIVEKTIKQHLDHCEGRQITFTEKKNVIVELIYKMGRRLQNNDLSIYLNLGYILTIDRKKWWINPL